MTDSKIIYTHTDEAPLLATYSFLPIIAGLRRHGGGRRRDPRHLAGGPHHRAVPDRLEPRAADRRRARRARRAGQAARSQHHQAAEHQRLDPAAQGGHRRAAVAGLRPAGLPRQPDDRRGEGRPRPLRQGQGQRGQPGAPRGQLRPPRARLGQAVRPQPPALDGRVDRRTPRPTSRTWTADDFRSNEKSARHRGRRHPAHRAGRRRRHDHGAARVGAGAGRRDRRRAPCMRVGRAARVPDRADRPRQGRGRAVLGAPQGHDDEGLRPDHLRPRGARVLARRSSRSTATRSPRPASAPTTGSARILKGVETLPRGRRRSRPRSTQGSPTARRSRWSTPTRASPTCTCPAT